MRPLKALIDTNVLLDAIFHREPFYEHSKRVFDLVESKIIIGCISVQSLKDIYCLCKKMNKNVDPYRIIEQLSFIFNVVDINREDSVEALMSNIDDYESALLVSSAKRNKIGVIIKRDGKGYCDPNVVMIGPESIDSYIDEAHQD